MTRKDHHISQYEGAIQRMRFEDLYSVYSFLGALTIEPKDFITIDDIMYEYDSLDCGMHSVLYNQEYSSDYGIPFHRLQHVGIYKTHDHETIDEYYIVIRGVQKLPNNSQKLHRS